MTNDGDLSPDQYRDLAEFRRQIRQFLHFSEATAKEHHVEPQQHQLLLAVQGLPEGVSPRFGKFPQGSSSNITAPSNWWTGLRSPAQSPESQALKTSAKSGSG